MLSLFRTWVSRVSNAAEVLFSGPQAFSMIPALMLAGYWIGGELVLIGTAIGLPLSITLVRCAGAVLPQHRQDGNDAPEAMSIEAHFNTMIARCRRKSLKCAGFSVKLDEYYALLDRYGQAAADHVTRHSRDRIIASLRRYDQVFDLGEGAFVIAMSPVEVLDLDIAIRLAERVLRALEEPVSLDATTIFVSACCGVAISTQLPSGTGQDLFSAAQTALRDAIRHGPSAIRAYTPGLVVPETSAHMMHDEITKALENRQIQPWFQPQVSTDTGAITGFEALARWIHPKQGPIAPGDFLPVIEEAGKLALLAEVMLHQSLTALKFWDRAGLCIPAVGVNFSTDELRDPKLVQKIEWELDRFDLSPDRLVVEILETVVAKAPNDIITRNINALSELGCGIDLDDFGTGHASISSLRRFAIGRLKIDRSFVMKVDHEPEQQRMIAAILLMAEQLGLDTLAEGVETAEEHAMLAQLGCRHVQGFGISRPLPFDKTFRWAAEYTQKIGAPPLIGRKSV